MKQTTLLPAFLALMVSRAQAQSDINIWSFGSKKPSSGPANATGTFTFDGPDLSTTNTLSKFEYKLAISVYAEATGNITGPDAVSSVAVVELTRDADPDKVDDGWSLCVNVWKGGDDLRANSSSLDDPGDCSAALPQACQSSFPSIYHSGQCAFPQDITKECSGFLGDGIASSSEIGQSAPLFTYWSKSFDAENDTSLMEAYGEEVNRVWVMQLIWSHSDDTGVNTTRVSGPVCVRAKDIAEGSEDPTEQEGDDDDDDDGNDGARRRVDAAVGWGAATALALLAFL